MSKMSVDLEKAPLNGEEEYGSTSDKLEFTSWKILDQFYHFVQLIFVLVSIHSLSKFFSEHLNQEDKTYLLNYSDDYGSCEDYKFGCCKIYDTCHVSNNTYYDTELVVDPKVVHAHNRFGDNCPRLIDMVEDYRYNHHYYKEHSDTCQIDLTCDYRSYFGKKLNESTEYIADAYGRNILHGGIKGDTGIPAKYQKCLSIYEIIRFYEYDTRGFNENEYYLMSYVSFLMLVFLCFVCYKVTQK